MAKKEGCGSCKKSRKKKARILIKGIKQGLTFDEAVRYAGLTKFTFASNYNLFLSNITKAEKESGIINKVEWQ